MARVVRMQDISDFRTLECCKVLGQEFGPGKSLWTHQTTLPSTLVAGLCSDEQLPLGQPLLSTVRRRRTTVNGQSWWA